MKLRLRLGVPPVTQESNMKKLLSLAAAVLFVAVPYAHADSLDGLVVEKMEGLQLPSSAAAATSAAYDFGFMSDAVRICPEYGSQLTYLRVGTAITGDTSLLSTNPTVVYAFSTANFVSGDGTYLKGNAMPIPVPTAGQTAGYGVGLTQDVQAQCWDFPLRARGIVIGWTDSSAATMDVQVFKGTWRR